MLGLPPWGSLRESVHRASSLGKDDLEASNKLTTYPAPLLSDLLKEQLLFNVGLSPLNPVGIFIFYFFLFAAFSFSYSVSKPFRSSFIVDMDADVARMLAKGLKAHKRKGAATSRSAKKARVEETGSIVLS